MYFSLCFDTVRNMANKEKTKKVNVAYVRTLRLIEKICPVCGKTFEGVKIRKFCSRACQNKADYDRHGEEYRQARMDRYNKERS